LSDQIVGPRRTVLDADGIFSRVLHGLFGLLATDLRMFTLVWSDELLAEAEGVLIDRKPIPPVAAAAGCPTSATRSRSSMSTSPRPMSPWSSRA
jgi:hypothetical protein